MSDPGPKMIDALLSISHDKDVDGLSAAAIVWRYANSKGLKHEVVLTDYGAFGQVFGKVSLYRNTLIVITDLAMDSYATVAKQILDLGGWGNIKVVSNMVFCLEMEVMSRWILK